MRRNLSEMYVAALECIRAHPNIIYTHIMNATGISSTTLKNILNYLVYQKLIEEVEPMRNKGGQNRYKKIYTKVTYVITNSGRNLTTLYQEWMRALSGNVEASNSQPSPFSANSKRAVNLPLRGD